MKAPFPYFGGKSRVAHLVWQRFGDVANYVEPFAGSLAVLLARPTAPRIETVNDKDCFLANFWRAVRADPNQVAHYADWPVNEADLTARHGWLVNQHEFIERMKSDPDFYDAKIAGWWVWGLSQWIGNGWCIDYRSRAKPRLSGTSGVHCIAHQRLPRLGNSGAGVCKKMPILGNGGVGVHAAAATPSRQMPRCGDAGNGVPQDTVSGVSGGIYEYFDALCERLRRVRVCCGDWTRVLGPAVTTCNGNTAIFLDPPYCQTERDAKIYSVESNVSALVRAWALENGDNPKLKLALCGYQGEHEMPANWECVAWKANGGYGAKGSGRGAANRHRERIWFSPGCFRPSHSQIELF